MLPGNASDPPKPGDFSMLRQIFIWVFIGLLGLVPIALADDTDVNTASGLDFFESRVRPILVEHCYACHSEDSGFAEGGLRLDTRETIRLGGERGPAVVPGDPETSLLLLAASHAEADLKMPPKKERLPEAVLNELKRWILMGAPAHREDEPIGLPDLEAAREFWAYQPPERPELPEAGDASWPRRDLDHFIQARLEAEGLAPSPDAEPHVLLRRLHFDLVGLPPSPEAIEHFLKRVDAEGLDQAIEGEAEELLASPQFGERWGRHWLDVARFGESSGNEANISFPYAWRYRDYVIDSLNTDMPYDRFLQEQIAGDLLPYETEAERARLLIATGFLAIGPKNLDEANDKQFLADVIDEQIDTVTRAVIGSTVACARCHDHKFDPFSMEDYYALAGIFGSTDTYFGTAVSPANRRGGNPLPLPRLAELPILHGSIPSEKVEELKAERKALEAEQRRGHAANIKAALTGKKPEVEFTLRDALRIFWRLGAIKGQLDKVNDSGQPLPLALGVLDSERTKDAPLLLRGEVSRPDKVIPRGFPRAIDLGESIPVPPDQSGRLELANWLTHPDHPLTSRVLVNRVWHHLLGAGLVRTVDHFGSTGDPPSHPELLDHLALGFDENGRSLKRLIREIVLSRTYRQASTNDEKSFQQDPENHLLWRATKRRLDAEAIRDAMLAASGELDLERPLASLVGRVIGDRPIALIGLDKKLPTDLDGAKHRSVYLPIIRDRLPDVLDLFDFADASLVTGARETTNVPTQALYLMNSPFVQERAEAMADRLARESDNVEGRVRLAFLFCFGRLPEAEESRRVSEFLGEAGDDRSTLANFCQAMLATAEFRNLD
ncbi:PSD1 and planctomycete cytochrome C domain-containing protein [soil metagenome]